MSSWLGFFPWGPDGSSKVLWALRWDHLDGADFEVSEKYLGGSRGVEVELVLARFEEVTVCLLALLP